MTLVLQDRIIEFHPELSWFRLAGKGLASKHTKDGIVQRKKLLETTVSELEQILLWKSSLGKAAALDDLLDAIVGIKVANESLDSLYRLPGGGVEHNGSGLRMEIWY